MESNDATARNKVVNFLRHALIWLLLAAALFYALHRYFEYREQQLNERLEQLGNTCDNF